MVRLSCLTIIGIGFTNGVVGVLDATTLEDVCQPFRYARDCVTHITFSHDSHYMATAVSHLANSYMQSYNTNICITACRTWTYVLQCM